jgi:hypothetical protein
VNKLDNRLIKNAGSFTASGVFLFMDELILALQGCTRVRVCVWSEKDKGSHLILISALNGARDEYIQNNPNPLNNNDFYKLKC